MATFKQLQGIIEKAKTITIWGHGLPDGDCYGCQIGLRDALRATYPEKKVYAIGTGIPALFPLIGEMDEVSEETIKESLAIIVDVSCLRRVEDQRVNLASSFMKFDHHNPNRARESFDGPSCVDMKRIAAAEIIYDFLSETKMSIPSSSANALYAGILTDSGGFLYYGTTKHTFDVAEALVALGAEPKKITDIVYYETPEESAFKDYMRAHTKLYGQVAYCWINRSEYESFGLTYEVASSFVNSIARVAPNKAYAYFCESPWGEIRVELRSNSGYAIQPVAAKFGGGGHTFAAGLSIIDGLPKLEDVLQALDKALPYNEDKEGSLMYEKELKAAIRAAQESQVKILEVYAKDFEVEIKSDNSPVTEADKAADAIIRSILAKEFPEHGFLTEESKDTDERFSKRAIWIVDPVDGTKEFVSKNGQFTTNIALCVDHEIVLGVINVPCQNRIFYAVKGQGAYVLENGIARRIHSSDRVNNLRALRSVSFFNEKEAQFMNRHQERFEGQPTPLGAALKFCAIAEGTYDYFIRMSGGTKEWDVAAGDILVSEAGGILIQPCGKRFEYNRVDVYNRDGYVLANRPENTLLD